MATSGSVGGVHGKTSEPAQSKARETPPAEAEDTEAEEARAKRTRQNRARKAVDVELSEEGRRLAKNMSEEGNPSAVKAAEAEHKSPLQKKEDLVDFYARRLMKATRDLEKEETTTEAKALAEAAEEKRLDAEEAEKGKAEALANKRAADARAAADDNAAEKMER